MPSTTWVSGSDVPTTKPNPRLKDGIAIMLLILGTTLAWCSAWAIWSAADLGRPMQYLEGEYCDFIGTSAGVKAITEGQFRPFAWKYVRFFGAPYEADWNGTPLIEEPQFALFAVLAWLFGLFAGFNIGLLIGHLAAAVTFYVVARISGCSHVWAFVSALAFSLAPYLFAQSPHHITCEYVWHVPLFLLVWRWVATTPGLVPGTPHFREALVIGAIAGLQNPYYTNILCQLTLLGGAIVSWRSRSRTPLLGAAAVVAAAAVTFALMNVDSWTYNLFHESNKEALVREYKWLEIYGLKIKDLFIPPVTHSWEAFSNFSKAHRQVAPLLDEGASYQGIVGLACLLWLVATAVKDMIAGREKEVPVEAWQVLWIVLMFTTGGLNALIGATTGFTMFRGGSRYSIAILAITLLWAARRLSAMQAEANWKRAAGSSDWQWLAAAACACLVILWDQVPRAPTTEQNATIARQVAADREFTEKMENALPEGAMVFQMPVMEFPEAPAPGMPPYDHFRPYLYSKNLRYSFGAMKGREREKWQPALQGTFFEGASLDQQAGKIRVNEANARAAVDELKRLGFSAIYINRNGFPDRGKGIEEVLLDLGYAKPPIRNATGDLACIVLEK